MTKFTRSHRDLKNTKKICSEATKKYEYSIRNISISDYESSLFSDSAWCEGYPDAHKDMERLDNIVTSNLKYKNKFNYAIDRVQLNMSTFSTRAIILGNQGMGTLIHQSIFQYF